MRLTHLCVLLLSLFAFAAHAAESQKIDIEGLKDKYWAKSEDGELRVIQNRLYTKAGKFELGVFGGFTETDPFLSVKHAGGELAYHLTELWGLGVIGWKSFSADSDAARSLRDLGTTANTNIPSSFYGGEIVMSPLYGKLSLLGKSIIYYDLHLLGGMGVTKTETGTYLTPLIGIGQQVYLGKSVCFRLDYRETMYHEQVPNKANPAAKNIVKERNNFSGNISLGFTFFLAI